MTPTPTPPRLEVEVDLPVGTLNLRVKVTIGPEVVAVVGPNGAGKTTLLRALAGLTDRCPGRIVLDGRVLDGPDGRVPPEERRIGMVFQEQLLFPHLDVRENVAFGLRSRGMDARSARTTADTWVARVGLGAYRRARPAELSGGQAQRIAMARALASDPAVLLLDEPLAALDVETRHDVRADLYRHLHAFGGPVVLVTHDAVEAATLADRIVVLEDGRVTHDGDVATITRHPRTMWAARLAGVNLLRGDADGTVVSLEPGTTLTAPDPTHGPVWVTVQPQAVAVYRERPDGSPRNVWPVTIGGWEPVGDRVRVHLEGSPSLTAELTPAGAASLDLAAGGRAWAAVKATEVTVYPR